MVINMKKRIVIALLVSCILTGCNSTTKEVTLFNSGDSISGNVVEEKMDTNGNDIINTNSWEKTLSEFKDVKNVKYAGNDKLIIVSDKMYLVNAITGDIEASTADCEYVKGDIKVCCTDNEIIVIGKQEVEGDEEFTFYDPDDVNSPKETVLYYDYDLNVKKTINISEQFGLNPISVNYIAINEQEQMAIYDDNSSTIYLCNLKNGEKHKIFGGIEEELVYDNILFSIVGDIEFAQDNKQIVFLAECNDLPLEDNVEGICGIGSVSIDGKNYCVKKTGKEYNRISTYEKFSIISQDCGFSKPTGEAIKYTFDNSEMRKISLSSKEESNSVYCSDGGSILAASNKNGSKGWDVHFYDVQSGENIANKSYDEYLVEEYREPKIYILDNLKVALVLFESDSEEKADEIDVIRL